ncbi:MAG: TauD/TfdA family dioxygenase [Alphaproteobacteria bacterium]|nr:TauD/TfdA family dioxygenase [Alphaproteobacteria bacterium]
MAVLEVDEGDGAWRGPDMAQRDDWIHLLTDTEIRELETAADAAMDRDIATLSADDFVMPVLDPVLAGIRDDVVNGRGFTLLRGVPVALWTRARVACAYWAIGTRIGTPVTQNPVGNVLGHVTDVGGDADNPNQRGHQSSDSLPFHTDIGAEIVGLLCLQGARSGGESGIVSAAALWNELVSSRPDLAALLTSPFYFDRRGEGVDGQDPWYEMPVFMPIGGRVVASYVPRFIRSAQRFEQLPRLTDQQQEALDLVQSLADGPRFKLEMDFRPGDIQLVNNLVLLHSRTAYEDWDEPARRRHLLRLWLSVPDGWPMPEAFFARYGTDPQTGRPQGINLPLGVTLNAPLTPPVLRT